MPFHLVVLRLEQVQRQTPGHSFSFEGGGQQLRGAVTKQGHPGLRIFSTGPFSQTLQFLKRPHGLYLPKSFFQKDFFLCMRFFWWWKARLAQMIS